MNSTPPLLVLIQVTGQSGSSLTVRPIEPNKIDELHQAIFTYDLDKVNLLFKEGLNVDDEQASGTQALIRCLGTMFDPESEEDKKAMAIFKMLLDNGAKPDAKIPPRGFGSRITPLIKATLSKNVKAVQLLLTAKANPLLKDSDNKIAFSYAYSMGHRELTSILHDASVEKEKQEEQEGKR